MNSQEYDYRMYCDMALGPAPSVLKRTQGILTVKDEEDFSKEKDQWDVCVRGKDKDTITLQVQIPCDIPVGIWRLQIITGELVTPDRLSVYDCPSDIYILFNPWNSGEAPRCIQGGSGKCTADDDSNNPIV